MTQYVDGKKAGEKAAAQPKIASDSAKSLTTVDITIGLSEGEIEGFSKDDITLDGTPLTMLSPDIICDYRFGTNDQTHIDGLDDVSNEVLVGVELTSSLPWVRSITNLNLDAIGLRLGWSALRTQESNGDVNGASVSYRVEIAKVGEPYVIVLEETVSDKTSDDYQRYREFELPKSTTGWLVRVTRTSMNSTSDLVSDKMYIRSYLELIKAKFTYPYTALVRLKYDAEMFANIAKVAVEAKGLKIKVPSNYNPETGVTSGIWDGLFKLAYSSNPAWIYYDLCTNPRYALGERITPSMIDKWSLYRLAQYCDQQVDDGYGGLERRFTCNLYIQSKERAYDIINRLGGLFRALTFWDGQQIVCDADIPQDTFFLYTNANVKDGLFEYSSVATTDKYSAATVAWDNPANKYETEYEVVIIDSLVQTLGYKPMEIDAWGCTSRGQAVRAGRWALLAESDTVTFSVGMDGHIPIPGKIIEIQDQLHAGIQNGGRILSISADRKTVEIDKDIEIAPGDMFIINASDTAAISKTVQSANGRFVTVNEAYEIDSIDIHRIWILNKPTIVAQKFRILGVKSEDRTTFTISAIKYNESKFDEIDFNIVLETPPTSVIKPIAQDAVRNVVIEPYDVLYQGLTNVNLIIKWERPEYAVKYLVEWKKDNSSWIKMPLTGNNSVEIEKVYSGNYIARVTAISAFDLYSLPVTSPLVAVKGKQTMPSPPVNLTATSDMLFAIKLAWLLPDNAQDTAYTRILSTSQDPSIAIIDDDTLEYHDKAYPDTSIVFDNLVINTKLWFKAKTVDKLGLSSVYTSWVQGQVSSDPDQIMDLIKGHIGIEAIDDLLAATITRADGNALEALNTANQVKQETTEAVNELITDINAEAAARIADVERLDDGMVVINTKVDGNTQALTNYKETTNTTLANLQQSINVVASDTAVAVQKVEALDGRVGTAEQNAASALNKAQIAIDDTSALSETVNANTVAIGTKASSAYVDQVKVIAETADGKANSNTTAITGLASRVGNNETSINTINQTKANKDEVASIAQQALQSTWQQDAQNKVDALRIGGANLIRGTRDFRTDGNLRPNYIGFGTKYETQSDLLFGTNAIYLATTSWCGFYFTGFPNDSLQEDMTLSFWASSQDNSPVHVYNITHGTKHGIITGAEWKQYAFFMPKGTKVSSANKQGVVEFDVQAGNVLAYSSIQLQLGNKATDWSPALEDTIIGGRNVVRNTGYPHSLEGGGWVIQEPLTVKPLTGQVTISFDCVAHSEAASGGVGFNMGDAGVGGYSYFWYPVFSTGHHSQTFDLDSENFTHFGVYVNTASTITNLKVEQGTTPTAWTPAPEDIQEDLREYKATVTNTYSTKADTTSAVASGIQEYNATTGNVKVYTASSAGWGIDGSTPLVDAGIRNGKGVFLSRTGRSYGVTIFNANGDWARQYNYDGHSGQADEIANRVWEAANDETIVITTQDEPQYGRNANMRNAFISIGGTGTAFDNLGYRGAYLLVGRKGLLEGGGVELITTGARIDYPLQFINGVPSGLAGNAAGKMQITATANALAQTTASVTEHEGKIQSLVIQTNTLTSTVTQAQQTADLALTNKTVEINLTAYYADSWYPVGIQFLSSAERSNILISANLNGKSHPAWATHPSGFSLSAAWSVTGSAWGVISPDRVVNGFTYAWTAGNISPVIRLDQLMPSSTEVIWLRGGGVYDASIPKQCVIQYPEGVGRLTDVNSPSEYADAYGYYEQQFMPKSVEQKSTTNTVTLQQQAQVIDGISANWTVKINNNGYTTGFGLVSTPYGQGVLGAAMFDVDAFVVGKAGTNIRPFVVVAGGQTVDGVHYPNAGAYFNASYHSVASIKTAYIVDAAITSAKIDALAVTTLKIQDNAVTVPVGVLNQAINKTTGAFLPEYFDFTNQLSQWETRFSPLATLTLDRQGGQCRFDAACNVADYSYLTAYAQDGGTLSAYDRMQLRAVLSIYRGNVLVGRAEVPPSSVIGAANFVFEGAINALAIMETANTVGVTQYVLKLGFANRGSRAVRVVINNATGSFGVDTIRLVALELKK